MEETKILGEQPANNFEGNFAAANFEESAGSKNELGSPIGKFKDANSLFSAYNELEKEFTKKCQKISELEKQKSDNAENAPIYLSENWRDEIKEFLESHKEAQNFSKEIAKELMEHKEIATLPNALDIAYAKVISKNYKSADQLIQDETFVNEKIIKNEKIKNRIIKEYLDKVASNTVPPVILDNKGSSMGFATENKPKSLEEARKIVEKMFF